MTKDTVRREDDSASAEDETKFQAMLSALVMYVKALDTIMSTDEGSKLGLQAVEIIGHIIGGAIRVADSIPGGKILLKGLDYITKFERIANLVGLDPATPIYRKLKTLSLATSKPTPDVPGLGMLIVGASHLPGAGPVIEAYADTAKVLAQLGIDLNALRKLVVQLQGQYGDQLRQPTDELNGAIKAFLPEVDVQKVWADTQRGARTAGASIAANAQTAGDAVSRTVQVGASWVSVTARQAGDNFHDADLGDRISGAVESARAGVAPKLEAAGSAINQAASDAKGKAEEVVASTRKGFTRLVGRLPFGEKKE